MGGARAAALPERASIPGRSKRSNRSGELGEIASQMLGANGTGTADGARERTSQYVRTRGRRSPAASAMQTAPACFASAFRTSQ